MTTAPRHRRNDGASPETIAALRVACERMTRTTLAERVYETAAAFKAAEDDPMSAAFARAERWADYMSALRDHAAHFVQTYKREQAKEEAK
ncbi:hypothetical protein [Arthrobacter sp. GMC3]|uniref:hypothetical protein n=1 Tax=Arthrobacter sp. GMC3 TaxID=2058894 RepID=UPI000CE3AE7C|nr:hypothetical protein [Arthrobacter sp. GMC3]